MVQSPSGSFNRSPNAARQQYRHTTGMFQLAPLAIIGLIVSMLHIYPISSWPANACKLKTKNRGRFI